MIISFEEFKNKEIELNQYKDSILKMIDEYIIFNAEFRKKYNIDGYIKSTDFYFSQKSDRKFTIQFFLDPGQFRYQNERSIMHKDYEDLQKFMEDPELYKATKNYNI
jgi:hypothetical protein